MQRNRLIGESWGKKIGIDLFKTVTARPGVSLFTEHRKRGLQNIFCTVAPSEQEMAQF